MGRQISDQTECVVNQRDVLNICILPSFDISDNVNYIDRPQKKKTNDIIFMALKSYKLVHWIFIFRTICY